MAEPAGGQTESSPAPVGGKRSAWISHIKSVARAKGIKFGEAMKIASKSFKGGGGDLVGKAGPMGGKRRRGTKKSRKGGALYGFAGGDGAGTGDLADGAGGYGRVPDATYHGSTELTGSAPGSGPAAGGRRRSRSRRSKSNKKGTVRGTRRR